MASCDEPTGAGIGDSLAGTPDVHVDGGLAEVGPAPSDAAAQCGTRDDCPDATSPCLTSACLSGACAFVPSAAGTSCDDGHSCTKDDTCDSGACVPGPNTCGCQLSSDCASQEDGDLCNGTLYCDHDVDPPVCKVNPASVVQCAKGEAACSSQVCDAKTGTCTAKPEPDGANCDDGKPCTAGDTCKSGVCTAGTELCECLSHADCTGQDDGNLCNGSLYCDTSGFPFTCKVNPATLITCSGALDSPCRKNLCDPKSGECALTDLPQSATCTDGDACTKSDVCKGGECAAGKNICPCKSESDCTPLQPKNKCEGQLFCDLAAETPGCRINPATVVTCTGEEGPCHVTACQPESGKCGVLPINEAKPCSDGNGCTVGDACAAGSCKSGKFSCTCTSNADCGAFEDGDLCNGTLFCDKSQAPFRCKVNAKTLVVCKPPLDGQCAAAACAPKTGTCSFVGINEGKPCDADGNACTANDHCIEGTCAAGANDCACQADKDCAAHEDGDACNGSLFCSKATLPFKCEVDPNSVINCPGGDTACATNQCQPATGNCKVVAKAQGHACNADNNACTPDDACDLGSCVAGPNACACTSDGDCAVKDDGNLCNGTLYCNKSKLPFQCALNPATVVTCDKPGDPGCAAGGCVPATGKCAASLEKDGTGCEDGLLCTKGDACLDGQCVSGPSVCGCASDADCAKLDDDNLCTAALVCDTSGPKSVCVKDPAGDVACPAKPLPCAVYGCNTKSGKCDGLPAPAKFGQPCNDGSACTKGDVCDGLTCKPGAALACDDGNGCTSDGCDALKGCVHQATQAPCSDDDPCTLGDVCAKGACKPGATKNCDDGNPCTTDGCVAATGACKSTFAGDKCDDGNLCTVNDACTAGGCTGKAKACDDGNACTADFCKPGSGCAHPAIGGACDDGNACTKSDLCAAGSCKPGPKVDCNDNNECTIDVCDKAKGCVTVNPLKPCDDGNPCTEKDLCGAGKCLPGKDICGCKTNIECTAKDDANVCNGKLYCDTSKPPFSCKIIPSSIVNCGTSSDPCRAISCDKTSGKCQSLPANQGQPCDADGSVCTSGDACNSGKCLAGPKLACNDTNPCTFDKCDAVKGCTHTPNSSPCSDGDVCTVGDTCKQGACKPGAPKPCDDGNPCTADACVKSSGCAHVPNNKACNDGDACTGGDACKGGKCVGGAAPSCGDGNPCTNDGCDKAKGCVNTANNASCEDGNLCTKNDVCKAGLCTSGAATVCDDGKTCTNDICESKSGACKAIAITGTCSDGNACTKADACVAGECKGKNIDCDDGNDCTHDSCNASTGCVHKPAAGACDDKNPCTVGEACNKGSCSGGVAKKCDDKNPCTADSCSPVVSGGCQHQPAKAPCSDGDPCTTPDACVNGVCKPGTNTCACIKNADCAASEDGNVCNGTLYCDTSKPPYACKVDPKTVITCSSSGDTACKHNVCATKTGKCALTPRNEGGPCDADGSVCTVKDACASGACIKGSALSCDDGNPCTNDGCNKLSGCTHVANTSPCDDGSKCTANDKCASKSCQPGAKVDCNDAKPCTDDSCSPATGCKHVANSAGCDDGDKCTTVDTCKGGACKGSTPPDCNDGNPCTSDACAKVSGCTHANNSASCDDGSKCTTVDACKGGSCSGSKPPNCDDGNPCTTDGCNVSTGCTHPANSLGCDDGSKCTTVDKCAAGKCVGASAPNCDDGDACTSDSCDKLKGCQQVHNTANCDDGDKCTTVDKCAAGACVGSKPPNCDDGNPCTTDGCDGATGCKPVNNSDACDDGSVCTTKDVCSKGKCAGGPAKNCDDGNPCTTDSCQSDSGCKNVNNTSNCDDGDKCTTADYCNAGSCVGSKPPNCDDGNSCTDDSCDKAVGCQNVNNNTSCSDGDSCTKGDSCGGGSCSPGAPVSCDDGNACTDDKCDNAKGCVVVNQLGTPCQPNVSSCNIGRCKAGACYDSGVGRLFSVAHGGKGLDEAGGVVALADGTFALAGTSRSTAGGDADGYLVVATATGTAKVSKFFGTAAGKDGFNDLAATSDGALVMVGQSDTKIGKNKEDMWLYKAKTDGSKVWQTYRGGSGKDGLQAVHAAANGDLLVAGHTAVSKKEKADVLRFSKAGAFMWSLQYGGAAKDEAHDVVETSQGDVVAVGWTQSFTIGRQAFVIRSSSAGKLAWAQRFGAGKLDDRAHAVAAVKGAVVVAGSRDVVFGNRKAWLASVNDSGKLLWEKTYGTGGSYQTTAWGLTAMPGGWVMVGERRYSSASTTSALWWYRVGSDGTARWSAWIGGKGRDWGKAAVTLGEDTLAAGLTNTFGAGGGDAWLLRINSWGHTDCKTAGKCGAVKATACEDNNPCTKSGCTPSTGCVKKTYADGSDCGDGKKCSAGVCK